MTDQMTPAERLRAAATRLRERAEKAETERDALRERLDALRADVERFRQMWGCGEIEGLAKRDFAECLARDDERGAR